jgi:hypothetical protein
MRHRSTRHCRNFKANVYLRDRDQYNNTAASIPCFKPAWRSDIILSSSKNTARLDFGTSLKRSPFTDDTIGQPSGRSVAAQSAQCGYRRMCSRLRVPTRVAIHWMAISALSVSGGGRHVQVSVFCALTQVHVLVAALQGVLGPAHAPNVGRDWFGRVKD